MAEAAGARLVLASASPRRTRILEALGVPHLVRPAHTDESLRPNEPAPLAAERLARAKAAAVSPSTALPVLAADTLVVCQGRVLGKPGSESGAAEMLRFLAGRWHEVVTGLCLARGSVQFAAVEGTRVRFAPLSEEQVAWYVATGEPLDKAGAYHVEGRGGLFVESIEGSPSNVAGLPVALLARLAREAGIDLGWG